MEEFNISEILGIFLFSLFFTVGILGCGGYMRDDRCHCQFS